MWTDELARKTTYTYEEVFPVVRRLAKILMRMKNLKHQVLIIGGPPQGPHLSFSLVDPEQPARSPNKGPDSFVLTYKFLRISHEIYNYLSNINRQTSNVLTKDHLLRNVTPYIFVFFRVAMRSTFVGSMTRSVRGNTSVSPHGH